MTDETSDDGFAVGYKKPPQHSRFQPGRSGIRSSTTARRLNLSATRR
jgi:hypothetical protein